MSEGGAHSTKADMVMAPEDAHIMKMIMQVIALVCGVVALAVVGCQSISKGIWISTVVSYIVCILLMWLVIARLGVFSDNITTEPFSPSRVMASLIMYAGLLGFGCVALKVYFQKHDRVLLAGSRSNSKEPAYDVVPENSLNNDGSPSRAEAN